MVKEIEGEIPSVKERFLILPDHVDALTGSRLYSESEGACQKEPGWRVGFEAKSCIVECVRGRGGANYAADAVTPSCWANNVAGAATPSC